MSTRPTAASKHPRANAARSSSASASIAMSPALRHDIAARPPLSREEQTAALWAIRDARRAAWAAALAHPLAADVLVDAGIFTRAVVAGLSSAWHAWEYAVDRAQASAAFADALLAADGVTDADDADLRTVADALGCDAARTAIATLTRRVNHVVERNLLLVASIAGTCLRGAFGSEPARNMTLDDLISEGSIGLRRAVVRFDVTRGLQLSTFATFWIRAEVTRAMADRGRQVRLPVHVLESLAQVMNAAKATALRLGRDATDAELAEALGRTPEEIAATKSAMLHPANVASRDRDHEPGRGGDVDEFFARMPDPSAASADDVIDMSERRAILRAALADVTPTRAAVLRMRHGIAVDPDAPQADAMEYADIAAASGHSKQRAKQIEQGGMRQVMQRVAGIRRIRSGSSARAC